MPLPPPQQPTLLLLLWPGCGWGPTQFHLPWASPSDPLQLAFVTEATAPALAARRGAHGVLHLASTTQVQALLLLTPSTVRHLDHLAGQAEVIQVVGQSTSGWDGTLGCLGKTVSQAPIFICLGVYRVHEGAQCTRGTGHGAEGSKGRRQGGAKTQSAWVKALTVSGILDNEFLNFSGQPGCPP